MIIKNKIYMLITLIFISVTIFITSCNNDEYDVFSETIFYGEWVNEDGTLYYCSDGTFSFTITLLQELGA